jgi:hypothetical protein
MKSPSYAMDDNGIQTAMAAWGARRLPARLDVNTTATLLGFGSHDIQVLVRIGMLKPLGNPAANAPKYFCGVEIMQLAVDRDWLSRASRETAKYWRHKRERQGEAGGPRASTQTQPPPSSVAE